MRTDVLGVGFDPVTAEEAVARVLAMTQGRGGAYICTPNPEIVMLCQSDPALMAAVNGADMVLPDGVGVVRAARTLGRPVPERIAGIDLFTALLERMSGRVYLLGGRPGVAEAAARAIHDAYPGVAVCGCHDGYFTDEAEVIRRIEASAPALVAVCLGSPKQELFMAAHRGIAAGAMIGLGGALDVLSGRKKRAPEAWRDRGLEWLWRLIHEPARIGRQLCLPGFLAAVRKQRDREWQKED